MIIIIHLIVNEDNLYKADYEMIFSILIGFKSSGDVILKRKEQIAITRAHRYQHYKLFISELLLIPLPESPQ
jgi:hypothetical protein